MRTDTLDKPGMAKRAVALALAALTALPLTLTLLISACLMSACTTGAGTTPDSPAADTVDTRETGDGSTALSSDNSSDNPSASPSVTTENQASGSDPSSLSIGTIVQFGQVSFQSYWDVPVSEDLRWRVLDVQEDRILVITEDIIELRPYNLNDAQAAWADSEIREWLNDDFLDGLPKDACNNVLIIDAGSHLNGESSGVKDRVFLLSVEEAESLFASNDARQAKVDVPREVLSAVERAYNLEPGHIEFYTQENGGWYWWLRNPSVASGVASVVSGDGNAASVSGVHAWGPSQIPDYSGIRPAMWLNTKPTDSGQAFVLTCPH